MEVDSVETQGGAYVGGSVSSGTFIGRDQIIVINGYTDADLERALARLREVLAGGEADLCADVAQGQLTITAPNAPRMVLSAKAADALSNVAARQKDVVAYLAALLVNSRYGRWATRFVPLAGTLTSLVRPPGWADVTPEFYLLERVGEGPGRQLHRVPLEDITQATRQYPTLVLLGEPGSGKTTILYKLVLDAARQRLTTGTGRLPLYCPLAEYRGATTPYDFVAARLRQFAGEDAISWLRHGQLCLFCDALNEMPFTNDRDYREKVAAWRRFVVDWPGNQIIFTCRSQDYSEPLGQHQVEIARLDDARIEDFLIKYEVGFAWERLRDAPLLDLVRNPYYLSMLAYLLARGGAWPESRAALFQDFVMVLLEREQRKQHPDWPGADVLHAAFAGLAGQMQALGAGTRLPQDEVLSWLSSPTSGLAEGVAPETVLRLGLAATLLDIERVPNAEEHARFYHHQVQEYFAAHALLARFQRGEDLRACWRQPRRAREMPNPGPLGDYEPLPPPPPTGWEEPTVLAAGLASDPVAFVEAVRDLNPVLAARCLTEAGLRKKLPELIQQVQNDLLRDLGDRRVHLRMRLAAGDALGRLGDPRFPDIELQGHRVLLPPLVYVPAGSFKMGSTRWYVTWLALRGYTAARNELPQHTIELPAFHIGRYPVTNAEYACFVDAGGYQHERYWPTEAARAWLRGEVQESGAVKEYMRIWRALKEDPAQLAQLRRAGMTPQQLDTWEQLSQMDEGQVRAVFSKSYTDRPYDRPAFWDDARYNAPSQPVVGVTWYEAVAYCGWLGEQLQEIGCPLQVWRGEQLETCDLQPGTFTVRLPTEAEWEKAARGTRGRVYPWGRHWDAGRANTWEGHVLRPSPVGAYPGSATIWGGYEFSGNVWEWTRSVYQPYPYRGKDGREDLNQQGYRVVRGGSWLLARLYARCASRNWFVRGYFDDLVGFRVLLSLVNSGQ